MGNVLSRNVAVLGVGLLGLLGGCGSSPEGGGSTGSGATTTQQTTETSATSGSSTDAPPAEPPGLTEQGGILIGPESAPVTVTVMSDYRCPMCADFQRVNGAQLEELSAAGTVRVEHIPVSILDRFSEGTRYSTRAAGAAFCVAETDRDKFSAFDKAMYASQPEGTPGLTSQEIAGIAAGVGVTQAGQDCITEDRYADYATKVTEDASAAGMRGTPTVALNGQVIGDWAPENLRQQIETMAGQ